MSDGKSDVSRKNISDTFQNIIQTPSGSSTDDDNSIYTLRGDRVSNLAIRNISDVRVIESDLDQNDMYDYRISNLADPIISASRSAVFGGMGVFGGMSPDTIYYSGSGAQQYVLSLGGPSSKMVTGSNTNFGTPNDFHEGDAIKFISKSISKTVTVEKIYSTTSMQISDNLSKLAGNSVVGKPMNFNTKINSNPTGSFRVDSDLFVVKNGSTGIGGFTKLPGDIEGGSETQLESNYTTTGSYAFKVDRHGNVKSKGNILSGWHGCGLSGSIKLLPRDFVPDDKLAGRTVMMETGSVGNLTMRLIGSGSMFASIPIPTGFTAISATVWGSDSTNHFEVYESNISSSVAVSKGQSTVNTKLNLVGAKYGIISTSYNYLQVKVTVGATDDLIYGGEVEIKEYNWGY